ncbi:uncharacterized protein LOC143855468 [Tasmannia lanceolata]|uniref:uncharacterized protein LOC143855468 n=1 Tax=Tasmannia lanceolata TaxID=3420 RepID=UPI004062D70E
MARASRDLSFTDDDLLPEGQNHTKPVRITILCNKKKVPEVLVDNGSALNVCPLSTANPLGFRPDDFIPSEQGILAYDGTWRDVIGTIAAEIKIGGEIFEVEFQVLDIKTSFFLRLGRPWLHKVGVIPSTLHQKLKFIRNNRVITVRGDPEPEIGQISQELVTENTRDVSLTGFSLEISTIIMEEVMSEDILFLSSTNVQVVKMRLRYGYVPGAGLGRNLQGPTEWLEMKAVDGLFGLGYKPTRKEVQEMKAYMLKWAECHRWGLEFPMGSYILVMNCRFRKEGADCPYYGFPEPWYDETGTKLPSLEIFFADVLPEDFFTDQFTETEEPDTDWVENLEPQLMDSLFQIESPVIAMIEGKTYFENPRDRITPAEGPLDDWTSQDVPQVVLQYSQVSPKESIVSKRVSVSEFDPNYVISNFSFDAGTIEVKSVFGVNDEFSLRDAESGEMLSDEFDFSSIRSHIESVDVNVFIESINSSSESIDVSNDVVSNSASKSIVTPDVDELSEVIIDSTNEIKDSFVYIPVFTSISDSECEEILVKEFREVFAWSYDDMPGLSEDIVQHRLPLIPGVKPKKQKLCKLKTKWELKVYEEVKKLLEVKFIPVVEYPEWLANIVPGPKKDGKVRMCVDFIDLNKVNPKDDFHLPNIDILVDNTAGHALLSFMDGFSGYNQIKMAPEDMMKTTFITQWGTYCYRVMPFGLKNAGATY